MFLRRIVEHLKTQNWTAVGLDLAIVIVGVFIGTQVANWNQGRIERRETAQLLQELRPALQSFTDFYDAAGSYYATSRAYADTAFAGWRGEPAVSDEQFVIAAYQASQISTLGVNGQNWATVFGGERLRDIDNADVRRGLANMMTFDYDQMDRAAVATRYREHVRQVIPEDIQDAIRAECGDRTDPVKPFDFRLPASCDLDFSDAQFAAAATALHAQPELVEELRWHRAAVASFLESMAIMDRETRQLLQALDKSAK